MPQSKNVSLVNIFDTLANLTAKNEVYYAGQAIYAEDENGNIGKKVGTWRWRTQDKSAGTRFNDLPWMNPPQDFGAAKLNVVKVKQSDAGKFAFVDGNTVITDGRFKGKTDYLVATTQFGLIRDEQLDYDANNGKLTLLNFELQEADQVYAVLPTGISADPDYVALNARVAAVEILLAAIAAPFVEANGYGGMVLWRRPANLIPSAWQEVIGMRGKVPKGYDPDDPEYATMWGTGGDNEVQLTEANIPKIQLDYLRPAGNGSASGNANNHPDGPLVNDKTSSFGRDNPDEISVEDEFRIVEFIELKPRGVAGSIFN